MRIRLWAALAGVAALAPIATSVAATPDSGSITLQHPRETWQGATFAAGFDYGAQLAHANATDGDELEPVCPPEAADPAHQVCDHHKLTINVPAAYWAAHHAVVQVRVRWPEPGDKLEMAAYDPAGKLIGEDFGADPMTLILSKPRGTYDIVVLPLISPKPTSYTATAAITQLPATPAHPSVGGPMTYRALPITNAADVPRTRDLGAGAHPLVLSALPIGAQTTEPTAGITPHGAMFINAALPTGAGLVAGGSVYGYPPSIRVSADGGRHWRNAASTDAAAVHNSTNDPYVYVDPATGRVFWLDLGYFYGSQLSYTDDDGKTWTNTVLNGAGVDDHPTIVTGRVPAGSNLVTLDAALPRIVYYCVNGVAAIGCDRSLDGGRTFTKVASPMIDQGPNCPGSGVLTGHLSSDPDGRVYLGAANCGTVEVGMTADGGTTWTTSIVSSTVYAADHDVETAEDAAGNVYAMWTESTARMPVLAVSRDHGATWSKPIVVAPPGVYENAMLTLTAGATGHVAIGLLGTTVPDSSDAYRPWASYIAVSTNALSAQPMFAANSAVLSDTGTRVVNRGGCCGGVRDFLDLKTSPVDGSVLGTLGVTCAGTCATSPKGVDQDAYQRRALGYVVVETGGPRLGKRRW